jgi:hypothetical protein
MDSLPQTSQEPPRPQALRSRRLWIWYFVALVALTVTAVVVLRVYLANRQLTPERLAEAQTLWQQNGPPNYDMKYTVKRFDAKSEDHFEVRVRAGKVIGVLDNGRPLESTQYHYHDIRALFGFLEDFLEQEKANPQQARATTFFEFDSNDGHLVRYVRSATGRPNGIEITVDHFRPLAAGESKVVSP